MYLSINYSTRFDYPEAVRQSHNEVRAAPTTDARQRLLSYRLTTSPAARAHTYVDYWGTLVDAFGIRLSHQLLEIEVGAVVETQPILEPDIDPPMSALQETQFADNAWEYLQNSRHTGGQAISELGMKLNGRSCLDALDELTANVHGAIVYESGATEIGESVDTILEKGRGVCQDYAHVLIAACRSVGMPARYVSGYLYAAEHDIGDSPEDQDAVDVQTHAWVEALIPSAGWTPRDPTNLQPVGERHVKIGAGRDYDDVPPLKGIYTGGGEPALTAGVKMRQLKSPPEIDYRQQ